MKMSSVLAKRGYTLLTSIGQGGFSEVYKVRSASGEIFACKFFDLQKGDPAWISACLKLEMRVMLSVDHPNLVSAVEAVKYKHSAFIVMKFAPNGSIAMLMNQYRKPIDEQLAQAWFFDIVSGLDYLHTNRIVHRDLKLENFLLTIRFRVMITDFGFSKFDTSVKAEPRQEPIQAEVERTTNLIRAISSVAQCTKQVSIAQMNPAEQSNVPQSSKSSTVVRRTSNVKSNRSKSRNSLPEMTPIARPSPSPSGVPRVSTGIVSAHSPVTSFPKVNIVQPEKAASPQEPGATQPNRRCQLSTLVIQGGKSPNLRGSRSPEVSHSISPSVMSSLSREAISCESICGTQAYMAPEINGLFGGHTDLYDGKAADIYSLGVCLFEMMNMRKPFRVEPSDQQRRNDGTINEMYYTLQMKRSYRFSSEVKLTRMCIELIHLLLAPSPVERPTTRNLLACNWLEPVVQKAIILEANRLVDGELPQLMAQVEMEPKQARRSPESRLRDERRRSRPVVSRPSRSPQARSRANVRR